VTGGVLVVGYLALGELFLIARRPIAWAATTLLGILRIAAVVLVAQAPISGDITSAGWRALDRTGPLLLLTISVNAIGTLILVGGALWSAYRFRRLGTMRNRMVGCIGIAAGTFTTATGGLLTRLGHEEFLYLSMAIGIAIIYWGYLLARTPGYPAQRGSGFARARSVGK
jgi:hypothetical protein